MRISFLLLFLIPVITFAQVKKIKTKTASAASVTKGDKIKIRNTGSEAVKTKDGYLIKGNITGFPDGTIIKMLNGNSGAEEQSTKISKGKFAFSGKAASPEFKILLVNDQQPYITVFLDNSDININADRNSLDAAKITGSPAHNDFASFTKITKPYEDLIAGKGRFEPAFMDEGAAIIEKFISTHPNSFFTPIAIFRYNQIDGDYAKLEQMYNNLSPDVKATPLGKYLTQQVSENEKAGYGKPLADFSQADTSGKEISLSAFKGKYVLIDFWASWCGPCRAENPNVLNAFTKYKDKDFTVLGISLDRAKQPWIDAIAADGLAWTQLSDLKFWSNSVAQQFGIQSIPQNFLLDPQGNLIGKNLRGAALDYKLSRILK